MKTKTVVLIGIAVCVLLLTSPVLASAGYSKIYGNANEDDTLDMRDVTYIKLVIFGKKPATTFADANYDGKISMLDVGQTKLIILDKEKKLTLIDHAGRTVTVPRPIERVVSISSEATRISLAIGAIDKLVGMESRFIESDWIFLKAYPEAKKIPGVGKYGNPNIEVIVSLEPDVVLARPYPLDVANIIPEKTGIPVLCVHSFWRMEETFDEMELIGKLLGAEKEAEDLVSYCNSEIDKVTEVTSDIPDSEKPKVYLAFWTFRGTITTTPPTYAPVEIAGGINVAGECAPDPSIGWNAVERSIEQIVKWNPDIILIHGSPKTSTVREDILSDPGLPTVNAVKNRKVYYTLGPSSSWDFARVFTECFYMAKLFHPEKFENLDLEKEGNEIFKRFYGADGLWTELKEEGGYI